jgi:hypothetical protein
MHQIVLGDLNPPNAQRLRYTFTPVQQIDATDNEVWLVPQHIWDTEAITSLPSRIQTVTGGPGKRAKQWVRKDVQAVLNGKLLVAKPQRRRAKDDGVVTTTLKSLGFKLASGVFAYSHVAAQFTSEAGLDQVHTRLSGHTNRWPPKGAITTRGTVLKIGNSDHAPVGITLNQTKVGARVFDGDTADLEPPIDAVTHREKLPRITELREQYSDVPPGPKTAADTDTDAITAQHAFELSRKRNTEKFRAIEKELTNAIAEGQDGNDVAAPINAAVTQVHELVGAARRMVEWEASPETASTAQTPTPKADATKPTAESKRRGSRSKTSGRQKQAQCNLKLCKRCLELWQQPLPRTTTPTGENGSTVEEANPAAAASAWTTAAMRQPIITLQNMFESPAAQAPEPARWVRRLVDVHTIGVILAKTGTLSAAPPVLHASLVDRVRLDGVWFTKFHDDWQRWGR